MAMETLACGVPTLISANTGHLDLLAMGFGHALPVGYAGLGRVAPEALKLLWRRSPGALGRNRP